MHLTAPMYARPYLNREYTAPTLSNSLFGSRYWLVALIFSITMHILIMHGLPWLNQINLQPAGMQSITASFKVLANPASTTIPAFEPPLPEIPPKAAPPIEPIKPKATNKPAVDKPLLQSTEIAAPKDFALEQTAEPIEQPIKQPTEQSVDQVTTETPKTNSQPSPQDNTQATKAQSALATTTNSKPIETSINNPNPSRANQDSGLLDAYGRDLQRLCERNKQYPAIAIRRNLEGAGSVRVMFNQDGKILSITIEQSTGQQSLDDQAVKMVEKSLSTLSLPPKLRGQVLTLSVPVAFSLDG